MKYRKLPVVIEAFQMGIDNIPDWFMNNVTDRKITLKSNEKTTSPFETRKTYCTIETLEGTMTGNYGDYIIKGVSGEIYPCKPDIFNKTYELVSDE